MPWGYAVGGLAAGAAGSLLSKGGGGGTSQAQSTNAPWANQQPYLQAGFDSAQNLYGRGPLQYYPGSTVAGRSPYSLQAQQRLAATGDPNSLTSQSLGQWGKTVNGDYLKADSNPYLSGAVDAALGKAKAGVSSIFGRGGGNNYGSSAHEEVLGRTLAETALPYYAANYQQERGRQLNAAQLAPGMDLQGAAGLQQAGGAEDAYQQSLINADKSRYDFGQTSPWDTLQRYQSAITGNYGNIQSQPYFQPNQLLNLLGGGAAGLGIYRTGQQSGLWGQPLAGNNGSYNVVNGDFVPQYGGYDMAGGPAYG